jgi:hypothetical protein
MSMVWTGSSNLTSIGQLFRMQLAAHFWHTVMQSTLNHWINNQTTINQQSTNIQLNHIIQIIILYLYMYYCHHYYYCHSYYSFKKPQLRHSCHQDLAVRTNIPLEELKRHLMSLYVNPKALCRAAMCFFGRKKNISNLNSLVYHSWSSNLILTCQL